MNEDPFVFPLETLLKFCSNSEPARRAPIDNPYVNHGRIVATDARILVAINPSRAAFDVSALLESGPDLKPENFPFDHDSVPDESWLEVPEVEVPYKQCPTCSGSGKTRTCKKCDGEGEIRCSCLECGHEHWRDCPDCKGDGKIPGGEEKNCHACKGKGRIVDHENVPMRVGPIFLSKVYLDKIRRHLPNPKIEILKTADDSNPVRFKFDGGLGYLMQIRRGFP